MSRVLAVLFISSVVVFGLCNGDAKFKAHLEDEIKRAQEETGILNKDNDRLTNEIKEVVNVCWKQIKVDEDLKNKGKARNNEQQSIIEDLYGQLLKIHSEKSNHLEMPKQIDSLKLGVKIMQENIEILKMRRVNGMSTSCMYLEGMGNTTKEHKLSTQSRARINETIVLEHKLMIVQSELKDAKNTNEELKLKLQSSKDLCKKKLEDLRGMLKNIGVNTEKADESIAQLKNELAEHKKKVEDLSKSSGETKAELEKWKMEAKKLVAEYINYTVDIICYEKLLRNLVLLVTPADE